MSSYSISDAADVLRLLGYADTNTDSLQLNSRHKGMSEYDSLASNRGLNCWQYIHEFKGVSDKLYRKIFNRYYLDMELFGYKFDRQNSVAYCEIPVNSEDVCC